MAQRSIYKTLKKRIAKTRPGKWLRQQLKARRNSAERPSNLRDETPLFIVAEKDFPIENAPYFYAEWLAWVAENDPQLHARIQLAHLPAELPKNTAVLHAWVQDPVRERDATTFSQLERLEASARRVGADIIHPAEALSNSRRDEQFVRLSRAGLRTPRVVDVDAGFADGLGGLSLPIVVRKSWGHCMPLKRIDSDAELAEWLAEQGPSPQDWVATEYIEVRSPDGNYRKYRYILFGDRGVCRHLIVSPNWEVRPYQRIVTDETIAEELKFVGGPCDAHDILNAARRELEFDIAAFDYSFDANGDMIVWEVNPYPDLSTPGGRPGEYLADSVTRTYRALAGLYHDRLATAH